MIPILRAKLRPPPTPAHYVGRSRLLHLVDELVTAPLTLVVAPAGTGKTSLLSAWVSGTEMVTAWFSLDEADADAAQLWSGVVAAIETVVPRCGEGARVRLRRRNGAREAVVKLLTDLEAAEPPAVVLVIDDLQLVDADEAVAATLALFVQHVPSWLHVVLMSRRQPELPLDRLRARGHLGELHYAELRFSQDEATELVSRLLPTMPLEQVRSIAHDADGWAASLQLAAIASRSEQARRGRDLPGVGPEIAMVDYVFHELLAPEDPELVSVLADVSVVDRVNPHLARALTGRRDAVDLLLRAESRGLFVNRLAPEGWFELHSLVREALVGELSKRDPDRLGELHALAAKWFEGEGEVGLALEHFLLAGQPAMALRLLAANEAELYDTGRETTIRRAIAAIPDTVVLSGLEPMIDYAWCHLLVNRRRFLELVDQAKWWGGQSEVGATLSARLTMLEATAAVVSCDWATSGTLAREALETLGDGSWRDPLGRFGWSAVARDVAFSERWDETLEDVRRADLALKRDPQRRIAFEGTHALGLALAGWPVDALRVVGGVDHAADVGNMSILRTELAAAAALAHRELGDRARALPELEELTGTPAETMFIVRVLSSAVLVEALVVEGAIDGARKQFEQAKSLVTEGVTGGGRSWLPRAGTLLALATGDVDEANHWAEAVEDGFWGPACAARVHLRATRSGSGTIGVGRSGAAVRPP